MRADAGAPRLGATALLRYALAATGGIIGYTPLLTLLLPIKLQGFAPADRYALLLWCSVAGALAAGFANIGFGWLGDRAVARGGGRRGWMLVGLVATATSFAGINAAQHDAAIVAAMVLFQVAVNVLLAQVPALIAQEVPAAQTNTAAALLTLGAPLAAAASALVVMLARGEATRLLLVAGLMALCVAPLLLARPRKAASSDVHGRDSATADDPAARTMATRRALVVAWATRLLVQIANSGVGLCLFFYFVRVIGPGGDTPAIVAQLLLVATLVPVPLALLLGRWCDRTGSRERVLSGTAILAGAGLLGMALCDDWRVAAICYVVFGTAVAIFQALNTGHAMLLLPPGMGQGRSLGLLNLANTLPQVIAPLLALLASNGDLSTVFALFALLSFVAAILPRASDLLFHDAANGEELLRTISS